MIGFFIFIFIIIVCWLQTFYTTDAIPPPIQEKIIGGESVEPGDIPWIVSVGSIINVPGTRTGRENVASNVKIASHLCGGIMLNPTTVLTLADCVAHAQGNPSTIGVAHSSQGRLTSVYDKGRVPASQILLHPRAITKTAGDPRYNVALLKLQGQISSIYQNAGYLDPQFTMAKAAAYAISTIGWGSTTRPTLAKNKPSFTTSPVLMSTSLRWVAPPSTQQNDRNDGLIYTVATKSGESPCLGDQGGPLIVDTGEERRVVGILYSPSGMLPNITPVDQWCTGKSVFLDMRLVYDWIATQTVVNRFDVDDH